MSENVTILISEDDRGHYILMKHRLQKADIGKEIVWLSDGQKTLDFLYARDGSPGLRSDERYVLLLDIRMPKIDGIEILEVLKKDGHLSGLPVVMVTSSDDPENIDRCNELGCSGYIVKPLDDDAISLIRDISLATRPV